jgi:CheY-like chemotaxis protein/two-component sensor histidine kinase
MAEQRERKRLSRILHDGLQQHLATAKMRISYFADKLRDRDGRHEALAIEDILGESIQMSRSLSVELSPPVLQEAGLAGGLEWLARWMRDKHNFNVELSLDGRPRLPEDVTVLVFESVRELLFNAVKHAKVSWARVSLQQNGSSETRIVVSDEGMGFDPALLTSMESAGGLGLFSIRERIDSIGGSFEIDSAPGKGCRFALIVPGMADAASALPGRYPSGSADSADTGPEGPRIRVLLVDDHALFRDGIGRILNQEPDIEVIGYARDGLEAIELARKLTPHMILMDIGMPGIDGIEATRVISGESSSVRIIGLSMYEDEERSRAILAAGAVGYKNKGCAPAELISTIRACMHESLTRTGLLQ